MPTQKAITLMEKAIEAVKEFNVSTNALPPDQERDNGRMFLIYTNEHGQTIICPRHETNKTEIKLPYIN